MSYYLAKCPICKKHIEINLRKEQLKEWDNNTLEIPCINCDEIIKPIKAVVGNPLHVKYERNKL